ncbi:MAG: guanylate kinase [Alphaproteobacteria bacterium]|jgi:guanylate kinase|nr:guanylate kinase [Alphaproteobacteria bacterium]MDP7221881.1 guanylate kinase [Alphaproteobacteria bacterium]
MNKENDYNLNRRGLMFVLSSPSGAGKTTISRALLKQNKDLVVSISATTRDRRAGEVQGQDYNFVDVPTFTKMVDEGNMMEHAKVFNHYYGTPKEPVEEALSQGKDVIFDIDWQGTQQLSEIARDDLVTVFILPPSSKDLENRLKSRAKDTRETDDEIAGRMNKASSEMSHYHEYDYIIINSDIEESIARAQAILDAERLRRDRLKGLSSFVRKLMGGV